MEATIHFNRFQEVKKQVNTLASRAMVIYRSEAIKLAKQAPSGGMFLTTPKSIVDKLGAERFEQILNSPKDAVSLVGDHNGQEVGRLILQYNQAAALVTVLVPAIEQAIKFKAGSITLNEDELRLLHTYEQL